MSARSLSLRAIVDSKMPGLSRNKAADLVDAARVCLNDQGHKTGCVLKVDGDEEELFRLRFGAPGRVLTKTHNDLVEATQFGAVAIAVNVICDLTDFVVVLRSKTKTGIDYWLGPDGETFEARLEISGILNGSESVIEKRVEEKICQMKQSDNTKLPGWAVVVEFSAPRARVRAK